MLFRDTERAPKYMGTGIGTSLLANRISWAFDLRGPSVPVDTACSGSLTALHFAHQSLKDRNSSLVRAPATTMFIANCTLINAGPCGWCLIDIGSRCFHDPALYLGVLKP